MKTRCLAPIARRCSRLAVAALCAFPALVSAQTGYTVLHHFEEGPGGVKGRLIQAADGHIYGTASKGGAFSGGLIYVMRAAPGGGWTAPVTLHDFRGSEGTTPLAGLTEGAPGILYGTTSAGGAYGGGTVFRIAVTGEFQVLRALIPATDGASPVAELTAYPGGLAFYGTTYSGGRNGGGTIFRVTTSGAFQVLRAFSGADGRSPAGAMAVGGDGNLYGTTRQGGAYDFGTAFRISPSGAFATVHTFVGQPPYYTYFGFGYPAGPLTLGPDGAFYGLTTSEWFVLESRSRGGAFRMTATGEMSSVFPSSSGRQPVGGITAGPDGWLYGATQDSRFFRTRPAPFTSEWLFDPLLEQGVGYAVTGPLLFAADGKLYGATTAEGPRGNGMLFSIDPAGPSIDPLHGFRNDGFAGVGNLLATSDGTLYGTTFGGGLFHSGTVIGVGASGSVSTLADSFGTTGPNPGVIGGVIALASGPLLASVGGALAEITTSGDSTYRGSLPLNGGFVEAPDGFVYGTVSVGDGRIYRTSSSATDAVHLFTGADGLRPIGGLHLASDAHVYGTTSEGGAHGYGTLFRFTLDGTLTTLHHFSAADGAFPTGTLVEGTNGLLYGTTLLGGDTALVPQGGGTIFSLAKDGTGFRTLHQFTGADGLLPFAGLTLASDGNFYGTTVYGGLGTGVLFAIDADGAFAVVHRFGPGEGSFPLGGVTEFNGALYGMTSGGGAANAGVVYRIGGPSS
jgi:uncharacterized repeat protein (TIGR03803 family)